MKKYSSNNCFKPKFLSVLLGCFFLSDLALAQETEQPASSTTEKSAVEEKKESDEQEQQEEQSQEDERAKKKLWKFGEFRLRLGGVKPKFADDEIYKKLYGNPKTHFFLATDYYFWQKYFAIGVGFKGAYYTAQGYAAQTTASLEETNASTITQDKTEPTELLYIPIQANLNLQFSPFPRKYLTIDGWIGYERGFLQEVRSDSAKSRAGDSDEQRGAKTNKTTINSFVTGIALNILLTPLDESSVNSMRSSMKIGGIYLSPFIEYVKPVGDPKGFDFKRTNLGLAFTFEGI